MFLLWVSSNPPTLEKNQKFLITPPPSYLGGLWFTHTHCKSRNLKSHGFYSILNGLSNEVSLKRNGSGVMEIHRGRVIRVIRAEMVIELITLSRVIL